MFFEILLVVAMIVGALGCGVVVYGISVLEKAPSPANSDLTPLVIIATVGCMFLLSRAFIWNPVVMGITLLVGLATTWARRAAIKRYWTAKRASRWSDRRPAELRS